MADEPLVVFSLDSEAPPLRTLLEALLHAGYPASISVGIAGDAPDDALDDPDWEAAFLRWTTPDLHDVALIERALPGIDEEADDAIGHAIAALERSSDEAGKLIAADHLSKSEAAYLLQIMPPLILLPDHPGWAGLDVAARTLARNTDGLIYADGAGFFDADGEPLVALDEEDDNSPETIGGDLALDRARAPGDSGKSQTDGE
jgi:hypothetical protein